MAREWLLVANWGAGARTDAFLVAIFLPEAVRMMLGAGLLSSAAMSWWQAVPLGERPAQLARFTFGMATVSGLLAVACWLGREGLLHLIGPGLDAAHLVAAEQALSVMAWSLPAFVLQAAWSVPLHAQGRYLLSGLASLAGSLNNPVRLRVPSLANSTSLRGLSSSTASRCRAFVHRLSSEALA